MGYTHYWYREPAMDPGKFAAAVADCAKVCNALPIPLGDGAGENAPTFDASMVCFNGHVDSGNRSSFARAAEGLVWPTPGARGVAIVGERVEAGGWFAGVNHSQRSLPENGDGSYEGFVIERERSAEGRGGYAGGLLFDCSKTNFRPYDLCVQCCLIVLHEHFGNRFLVRSDGTDEQWNEARDVCQHVLGYGLLFRLASPDQVKEDPEPPPTRPNLPDIGRNEAIKRIRTALKRRTGREWSVTGGRGTAWGWIRIDAPPRRRNWVWQETDEIDPDTGRKAYRDVYDGRPDSGHMSHADRETLRKALGLSNDAHHQGISIPASGDYYREYVDRAEGRTPAVYGKQYWD